MIKSKDKIRNLIICLCLVVAFVASFSVIYITGRTGGRVSEEIGTEKAQEIIDATFKLDLNSSNKKIFIPSLSNKSNIFCLPFIKSFMNILTSTSFIISSFLMYSCISSNFSLFNCSSIYVSTLS